MLAEELPPCQAALEDYEGVPLAAEQRMKREETAIVGRRDWQHRRGALEGGVVASVPRVVIGRGRESGGPATGQG